VRRGRRPHLLALAARHPAWEIPVSFVHFLGAASFSLFLYLFPDGRFVPRWARWVALVWIAWQSTRYFFPDWHLDESGWYTGINTAVWLGALGTAVFSQIHRYRRATSSVQQQIKWVVFGISVALAGFLGILVALGDSGTAPTSPGALAAYLVGYTFAGYLVVLLIPASIGIAILRYRLWDIDVVISHTLVYGTLTAVLAGIFEVVAVALQHLLLVAAHQEESQIIYFASAMVIAILFEPLRSRIQRFVDYRIFRREQANKTPG
jgi:hypothetical protein